MADMSKINQRRSAQNRVTENRDAVNLTRREDRTPDVRVTADLRSAFRADPAAQRLNDFFRQAEGATQAFMQADLAQRREDADIAYADGIEDATAGREMSAEQRTAVAYERAYFGVTAARRQTKFETETQAELDRLINGGATVEEIEAYMGQAAGEFIAETQDLFEQPDIKRQVGERMMRWTGDLQGRASQVIKQKTDRELVDGMIGEAQSALSRGEPLDLLRITNGAREAGLDPVQVQDEIVAGVIAYSQESGDMAPLYGLLDTRSEADAALAVDEARANDAPLTVEAEPAEIAAPSPSSTFAAPIPFDNVTSEFGPRRAPKAGASTNHGGMDIAVPIGTPVSAPAAGEVIFAGRRGNGGNTVIVQHANGVTTGYAHLDQIDVKVGDTVAQGQQIAKSGNTGNSTGPHLHFSARRNGRAINPRELIGQQTGAPAVTAASADTAEPTDAQRGRLPGASVLTPAQTVRVLNAVEQVEGKAERDAEKLRLDQKDDLMLDLYGRAGKGEDVAEIIEQNVRTGVLEPAEAMALRGAFRSMRESVLDGEADEDLVLRYHQRFAVTEPAYGSIITSLDRDYNAGRFGTGRRATAAYLELRNRAATGSRGDRSVPPEERRTATVARGFVGSTLSQLVGESAPPQRRRIAAEAMIDWEQRVASGTAPMAAADAVISEYVPRLQARQTPANQNARPVGSNANQTPRPSAVTRVDRNGNIITGE